MRTEASICMYVRRQSINFNEHMLNTKRKTDESNFVGQQKRQNNVIKFMELPNEHDEYDYTISLLQVCRASFAKRK